MYLSYTNFGFLNLLQNYFTEASKVLFKATKYRAYFRNITILLPSTWNEFSFDPATRESFERANIIIAKPTMEWSENPYVRQIRGCGEPGEYMHLTPSYLTHPDTAKSSGPPGKVKVTALP